MIYHTYTYISNRPVKVQNVCLHWFKKRVGSPRSALTCLFSCSKVPAQQKCLFILCLKLEPLPWKHINFIDFMATLLGTPGDLNSAICSSIMNSTIYLLICWFSYCFFYVSLCVLIILLFIKSAVYISYLSLVLLKVRHLLTLLLSLLLLLLRS